MSAPSLIETYPPFPFTLVSGAGSRVCDGDGREYLDLYGGHAVALLGQAHPGVSQALSAQADRLSFYSTAATLEIRSRAADRLCAFAGAGLGHVFFCNSGAEANENALKLAIQQTGRTRIAALRGAFHGRTLLALAATDNARLHQPFKDVLPPVTRLAPESAADLAEIDARTAAVIVEPIQSMAGVVALSPEYLSALRRRCDELGAWLIYDEVQTGMGRLGRPLAAGDHGVSPDVATLAKGMANGVPIGAVLMTPHIAQRVETGDLGSTFGGGPLACAALLAVLDAIGQEHLLAHAESFGRRAARVLKVGPVAEVLGCGCLLGLRLSRPAKEVQQALLERRIIVATSGDPHVIRLLPPINTPLNVLDELADALRHIDAGCEE